MSEPTATKPHVPCAVCRKPLEIPPDESPQFLENGEYSLIIIKHPVITCSSCGSLYAITINQSKTRINIELRPLALASPRLVVPA